jgi:hypothetical protein
MKRPIVATLLLAGALALFPGCGATASHQTAVARPTPTVDAATQAYIAVLRAYYTPYETAEGQAIEPCIIRFAFATLPQQQQLLATCRPLEVAALTAAQAALAHLATTPPPPRWQAPDRAIKSYLQSVAAYHTARLRAIDANSVPQYESSANGSMFQAISQLCGPIQQIDIGPPPLAPPLVVPDQGFCGGGAG